MHILVLVRGICAARKLHRVRWFCRRRLLRSNHSHSITTISDHRLFMKHIPAELFLLHQWFVVEESLSIIRHDLRNRLGAIRNANFYLRRRIQKLAPDIGTTDPRVPDFFALIATEADATEPILESRLPAPEGGELVTAASIVQRRSTRSSTRRAMRACASRPTRQRSPRTA